MIRTRKQHFGVFFGALLVGLGLSYVGLTQPETIFSILHLEQRTIFFAVIVSLVAIGVCFKVLPGITKSPIFWGEFEYKSIIPGVHILLGGILFGIGWGVSGMSPSTALVALGSGLREAFFSIAGIVVGVIVAAVFYKK